MIQALALYFENKPWNCIGWSCWKKVSVTISSPHMAALNYLLVAFRSVYLEKKIMPNFYLAMFNFQEAHLVKNQVGWPWVPNLLVKKLGSRVTELKLICHFHHLLAVWLQENYLVSLNLKVSIGKMSIIIALNCSEY